ncbi:MAG TPA: hypothetical protein VGA56_04605 [Opitutaceae bacterium]
MNTLHPPRFGPASRWVSRLSRSCIRTSLCFSALGALAALSTGCATHYKYGVEAVNQAADGNAHLSYQLVDVRPGAKAGDPLFSRASRDVQTALSSKGLYAAPAGTTPHLVIEVDFGISAPVVTHRIRKEPVFVMVPRASGLSASYGGDLRSGRMEPLYLESREIPYIVTTYEKFLRLTAREHGPSSAGSRGRQIWSVFVANQDKSDQLARHVRLMAAAAMDHIGRDLASERRVVLTMRDGRVVFVERGMGEEKPASGPMDT